MKPLVTSLSLLVGLVACNPQNAKVTEGSYTALLSTNTSATLRKQSLDVADYGEGKWDEGEHWQVDCREGLDADDMLANPIDICGDFDPEHEQWLKTDGYEVVTSPLDPWRGEAIMTSEGDLQVTFHQRLPGGEDFRFAFVVDPDFQPSSCQLGDDGNAALEPIDGDWVQEWSAEEAADAENPVNPDAPPSTFETLYYLNAGAYQFNPASTDVQWFFPTEWLAGFASAKFADDSFASRSVRYGNPSAYASFEENDIEVSRSDLFYISDPEDYDDLIADVNDVQSTIVSEFAAVGVDVEPKVHTNLWRPADDAAPGLDKWGELNYNWVGFNEPASELVLGNPASGEFHLVFDGTDSQSRVVVRGTFEIKKIKKDQWTVDDLETTKLEENATALCE